MYVSVTVSTRERLTSVSVSVDKDVCALTQETRLDWWVLSALMLFTWGSLLGYNCIQIVFKLHEIGLEALFILFSTGTFVCVMHRSTLKAILKWSNLSAIPSSAT